MEQSKGKFLRSPGNLLAIGVSLMGLSSMGIVAFFHPTITSSQGRDITLVVLGLMAIVQVAWVIVDGFERRKSCGWWPLLVLLLGPLGVWAYLVRYYRWKAVLFIPLSIIPYYLVMWFPLHFYVFWTVDFDGLKYFYPL